MADVIPLVSADNYTKRGQEITSTSLTDTAEHRNRSNEEYDISRRRCQDMPWGKLSQDSDQCPRIGNFGWKTTPYKQQFSTRLYKFEIIFHSFS